MPNTYTTLDKVQRYLSLGSANVQDDEVLLSFMNAAARAIDRYTRRKFYPRTETRFYDYKDSLLVKVDDDLLEVVTLKTQNGASTIASGVMWLGTGDQWNRPPYDRIVLDDSAGCVLNFSGTPQRANEVTATWGYHEEWGDAWVNTGASLATSYPASATSMALGGASVGAGASDANFYAPRISVGDLLKIDSEYFEAVGGISTSEIRLRPHANGTTAASHGASTLVYKYRPEGDVEFAALRLTAWQYGQKDTPYQVRTANPALGDITIPTSWPSDVRDKLDRFKKRTMTVLP